MDEQDNIHIVYAKLYNVSKKHEKLYRLRTISWLRRPRSLRHSCSKSELNWRGLQVQSLTRCLASNQTGLGYDFSSPNITSTSTTVFVSPANNVESENNDVKTTSTSENINNGKSILGAPPKLDKKETKNPRAKKGNTQKSK